MSTWARRGWGPAPGSPAGSASASRIHSGFNLVPSPHRGSLLGPRAAERKEQTARLLGMKCSRHSLRTRARWDGKTPPLLRAGEGDAAAHLWGVLLELSALLDEPLSRLLAFILPVRQYCCGGIEFPLQRETRREGEIVIALCTGGEHICTRPGHRVAGRWGSPWLQGSPPRGPGGAGGQRKGTGAPPGGSHPPPCADWLEKTKPARLDMLCIDRRITSDCSHDRTRRCIFLG